MWSVRVVSARAVDHDPWRHGACCKVVLHARVCGNWCYEFNPCSHRHPLHRHTGTQTDTQAHTGTHFWLGIARSLNATCRQWTEAIQVQRLFTLSTTKSAQAKREGERLLTETETETERQTHTHTHTRTHTRTHAHTHAHTHTQRGVKCT